MPIITDAQIRSTSGKEYYYLRVRQKELLELENTIKNKTAPELINFLIDQKDLEKIRLIQEAFVHRIETLIDRMFSYDYYYRDLPFDMLFNAIHKLLGNQTVQEEDDLFTVSQKARAEIKKTFESIDKYFPDKDLIPDEIHNSLVRLYTYLDSEKNLRLNN